MTDDILTPNFDDDFDRIAGSRTSEQEEAAKANGHNRERTIIQLTAGNLHNIATQSEAALVGAGVQFYTRDGAILKPIIEEAPAAKGRKTKVARIRPVTENMMRDMLSRVIDFQRFSKADGKFVSVDPPRDLPGIILSRDGEWRFPPLRGIITSPTMRHDGTILAVPGYDPVTQLLLLDNVPLPPIPELPSIDDATAAIKFVDQLLDEFPFLNKASRSVALSMLITPIVRAALTCSPLHVADAPEAGSGKSYLADIASNIMCGQDAPVMAAGKTEDETEKRLGAILMTGQQIAVIDNLNGELGGDFLCQAVERPVLEPRILGQSVVKRIYNTYTLFGNGNNVRTAGDLVRRVILASLDANLENPELRQFKNNPVELILADRGRYIAAILTVVRAYMAAGYPGLLPPIASFQDWSKLVRSPLVWLGYADPVETMKTTRANDPSRGALQEVVAAWERAIGLNVPLTAGAIKHRVAGAVEGVYADLNVALSEVACGPGRTEIEPKRLGKWLDRNKGRIACGFKIMCGKDAHVKQNVWWIEKAAKEGP
jgi:putative DNA primase/helicase